MFVSVASFHPFLPLIDVFACLNCSIIQFLIFRFGRWSFRVSRAFRRPLHQVEADADDAAVQPHHADPRFERHRQCRRLQDPSFPLHRSVSTRKMKTNIATSRLVRTEFKQFRHI